MNLLRKYFFLGAVPALIAVGLATVLDSYITQGLLQEQIDQTMWANLDAKRNEVKFFMDEKLALLKAIASMPLLKNGEVPEIVSFLKSQESGTPPKIERLYFYEMNGKVHAANGSNFNVADRDYFPGLLRGETVITRILKSRDSGRDILLMIVPVFGEDGTQRGAFGLSILDSELVNFVRSMEVRQGGFLALMDDANHLIAATGMADFLKEHSNLAQTPKLVNKDGESYLVSVADVPDTYWKLVEAIPEARITTVYNRLAWSKITAVACGLTAAVILALFFSERTLRPLQEIIQTIHRYARGEQAVRITSKRSGEFAILADSFNNMADELDVASQRQEAHLRTIETSETRFRLLFDGAADAIYVRDLQGKIIDANQEACHSLGYLREELIGMSVADIDLDWNLADGMRVWNELARNGRNYHPLVERVHRRKDGTTFPVEIRLTVLERAGQSFVMSAARDATLRKAAEQQTQAAKEFAENVISASPGIIYIFDLASESIVFANDNMERQLGYSKEIIEQLGSKFYVEAFHPDDLPRIIQSHRNWFESDEPAVRRDNLRVRHKNGDWLWFDIQRVVFQRNSKGEPTQIMGIAVNITDRIRAEEQLRWEKALLDQVMETSVASIMVVNAEGAIQFLNTALENSLRVGRNELVDKVIYTFPWQLFDLSGNPLPDECRPFARVSKSQKSVYDICYRIRFAPDDEMIVSINGAPLFDQDGAFAGGVFALTDITERIESERVREALIRNLEATNAELKQFTYTVSHDLKSPLITIKGFLGILSEDLANNDQKAIQEDLTIIGSAADGMKQLLDDLLELSRIGRNLKTRSTISLQEVIGEAITLLAGEIEARGAEVGNACSELTIFGDPVQIRQLMQNLIDNAIKHNREANPQVNISATKDEDFVVVEVTDNGPGVAVEFQERIFQLFDKLDPDSGGTGIGLAIVKRIIDFHGGTIKLESDGQGHGCKFILRLPAGPQAHNALLAFQEPSLP
ncbi:PAS domain S-box protein [Bremerella cremea]|uniref:histidine kinase n=1 Tax=Bremerella cremea TaxID=1031537 RepID=A0A368KTB2_9BACT|nr:PAS domain S-box protein [Bremerella cremea]RCS49179.1 PAS domain S-box protein [Bremerella cremea]